MFEVTMEEGGHHEAAKGKFPQTQWSVVILAGNDNADSRKALAQLCESYWYPVYCFLRRSRSTADAEDLVQGFFEGILRRDDLGKLTDKRGRFRTFLLTALNHHVTNDYHRHRAAVRGGGDTPVSIDYLMAEKMFALEPRSEETPQGIYERYWARRLFDLAKKRLEKYYRSRSKEDIYHALHPFIDLEMGRVSYQVVSQELECSEGTARKAVYDLRRKLREFFRLEVSQTVSSDEDLDDECDYLIRILAGDVGPSSPI